MSRRRATLSEYAERVQRARLYLEAGHTPSEVFRDLATSSGVSRRQAIRYVVGAYVEMELEALDLLRGLTMNGDVDVRRSASQLYGELHHLKRCRRRHELASLLDRIRVLCAYVTAL